MVSLSVKVLIGVVGDVAILDRGAFGGLGTLYKEQVKVDPERLTCALTC